MDYTFLVEFGIILIIATGLGIVAKLLKQPLILAYLVAGILIGPLVLGLVQDQDLIKNFSTFGIVLLLFLVGLELNPRRLLEIGKPAAIIGVSQVLLSGTIYYLIGKYSDLAPQSIMYIAIALTFSSTAIIITLLSNKKDLDHYYGRILVGILLVQDFIALILLTFLAGMGREVIETAPILQICVKIVILFALTWLCGKYILPPVFKAISRSYEILFLAGIAWCFLLAIVAHSLGFSMEVGAFLAGISLAPLPYNQQLISKAKPLRDFFLMIFFINLGTNLAFDQIGSIIGVSSLFILAVLIINPIIVIIIMALLGYRKRTSFLVGSSLTQISEFAYLIVALGIKDDFLPASSVTMISIIFIATVFFSSYLITFNRQIYRFVHPLLRGLERKKTIEELENLPDGLNNHIILIGCHRMGSHILSSLLEIKEKVVVVDFNSHKINELIEQSVPCIYGDGIDHDLVGRLFVNKARMVISTVDNFEESTMLINLYRSHNKNLKVVVTAYDEEDAAQLYKLGADFVVIPSAISGEFAGYLLKKFNDGKVELKDIAKKEIANIATSKTGALETNYLKSQI